MGREEGIEGGREGGFEGGRERGREGGREEGAGRDRGATKGILGRRERGQNLIFTCLPRSCRFHSSCGNPHVHDNRQNKVCSGGNSG